MTPEKLAQSNHKFLVVEVPECLFGDCFGSALWRANAMMVELRNDRRDPGPDDFCHCGFETGYVGVTAPAAAVIVESRVDLFALASALYMGFGRGADTGEFNDRVNVVVNGHAFTFTITDYETDDPVEGKWKNVTNDPLAVPVGQEMHRRVIISLTQKPK